MTERRRPRRPASEADHDRPSRRSQHNATLRERRRRNRWLVPVVVLVGGSLLLLVVWRVYDNRAGDSGTAPAVSPASVPLAGIYQLDHERLQASLREKPDDAALFADLRATLTLETGGVAALAMEEGGSARTVDGSWQIDGDNVRFEWSDATARGIGAFAVGRRKAPDLHFSAERLGDAVFVRVGGPEAPK
jgi:hypothetical protein